MLPWNFCQRTPAFNGRAEAPERKETSVASEIEKRNAQQYLDRLIAFYRNQHVMPAVGAGIVLGGKLVVSRAVGVRKHGASQETQPDDLFQFGSITKPMTGYLLARLIQQGELSWGSTIGQSYPDVIATLEGQIGPGEQAWSNHYRDTTVVDLMTHTSGVDYMPLKDTNEALGVADHPDGSTPDKNLISKRKIYTSLAVQDRPFAGWSAVGGGPLQKYSGGCIIVASMAEKKTGKTWESLMEKHVFQPLGITHYAFGRMSSASSVTNTWQHQVQGGQIKSSAEPRTDQIAYTHGPAGAVGLSVGDFGKWMAAVLTNSGNLLSQANWDKYVKPPPGHNCSGGGWFGDGNRLTHSGSNLWNQALAVLDIKKQLGVFACTNIWTKPIEQVIGDMCTELEAMADAWDAFGYFHQAVEHTLVSASADSVWDQTGSFDPRLVSDTWFRTRWASKTNTPTLTARLDQPRMLKGVILCQAIEPRIQSFEIVTESGDEGVLPKTLSGLALVAQTTRSTNGLVIRTLFDEPTKAKTVKVKVKTATNAPTVSRLLVLEYLWTAVRDFDIDLDGRPWVADASNRILTTTDDIGKKFVVLSHDTGGLGSSVRKAGPTFYAIGGDSKVWRGTNAGWFQLADSVTTRRIAADHVSDTVWSINEQGRIRRHDGARWVEHPGGGQGKDICVRNSIPFIVGMDDFIWRGTVGGWLKLPGSSPRMRRIAIDEESAKLWALSTANKIFSYDSAGDAWTEHPGDGSGKSIVVHKGVPYVVGMNDAVWKSIGSSGWTMLNVLQDKI